MTQSVLPFRRALALTALLCATLPLHAQSPAAVATVPVATTATRAPIEAFFEHSAFGGAVLSPSGKYLAARSVAKNGHDVLAVIDLDTRTAKMVAGYTEFDIDRFQWVNDDRLVYTLEDKRDAPGETWEAPGLFAVNRDGSRQVQLAYRDVQIREASHIKSNILPWHTFLLPAPGAQDSEFIYVLSPDYNTATRIAKRVSLLRLNTLTGVTQSVQGPADVQSWMLDHQGQPRLAFGHTDSAENIYYLDPATGKWRVLATFDAYLGGPGTFTPVGFGPDGTLYVEAGTKKGTTALFRFNFAIGKPDAEPLMAAPGFDFYGRLIRNRGKLLGAVISTDTRASVWFDPAMQAWQAAVDKALPATVNVLSVPADPGATNILVESYSDKVPSRYSLFNTKGIELSDIGSSRPAIAAVQMGTQKTISYKARDGLTIPALLTLPPGGAGKNLPMVVLVHGGPWTRGAGWGWQSDSQFLASRGYAVLEPSFRGTEGLGYAHFKASFKQWGLAMQDDIADGTKWAIAQGYADPARICIAGASYGGYATLMGLIKDPALYKCGFEWVGVTDINLMYSDHWLSRSDFDDNYKKYGMPRLIGDQVQDADQLKATSPIEQSARITQPLLLAYGGSDVRVPMSQGRLFYDKVKKTNNKVIWVDYAAEGHGWYLPKNKIDFWSRVEKFLATNIGQP